MEKKKVSCYSMGHAYFLWFPNCLKFLFCDVSPNQREEKFFACSQISYSLIRIPTEGLQRAQKHHSLFTHLQNGGFWGDNFLRSKIWLAFTELNETVAISNWFFFHFTWWGNSTLFTSSLCMALLANSKLALAQLHDSITKSLLAHLDCVFVAAVDFNNADLKTLKKPGLLDITDWDIFADRNTS